MNLQNAKIAVLLGGKLDEHAVSTVSGQEVVKALTPVAAQVLPVYISRSGEWYTLKPDEFIATQLSLEPNADTQKLLEGSGAMGVQITPVFGLKELSPNLAFIALHGQTGEDGLVQGALELAGISYTGSQMLPSAVGMQKAYFHAVLSGTNINLPETLVLLDRSGAEELVVNTFGDQSVVVKPANLGSSVGVTIAHNTDELPASLDTAFAVDKKVIVQEYIRGGEFTVAVLGTDKITPLPVIQIIPEHEFFDYESKYLSNATQEICPAPIPDMLAQELQRLAILVYQQVGCRHFGRVDFLVRETDGLPFVLEINTIPGLTPSSLLPKAAAAAGIPFEKCIQQITQEALGI